MKKLSKIIAVSLVLMILAGMAPQGAFADEIDMITVSFRIEGVEENIYYNKELKIAEGSTVEDLIKQFRSVSGAPKITVTDSTYGVYISEIDGLAEFAHGGMSGWNYRVNDVEPSFGISLYKLKDSDSVVFYYGDPFGIGMQYPVADWSRILSDGIIRFTSVDTVYDEDWIPTRIVNPVVGATVTFRWNDYITDEKGEIKVTDKTGLSGFRTTQIERYDEQIGVPTVLRFAPDYEIYIPFADTPRIAPPPWYENAVRFCVREEYFIGTNLAANLFEPMLNMTMTQLVTVLARIGGVDADLTTGELWYMAPLDWAIMNGVLTVNETVIEKGIGAVYELTSGMNVTREKFIYMFYLTVRLTGDYDMTVRKNITVATDYDDITDIYRDAISWAVASGIIGGTNPNTLTISPSFEVNRATVCQMLYNFYSI